MVKSTIFFPLNFSLQILKNKISILLITSYQEYIVFPLKKQIKVNNFSHTLSINELNNKFSNSLKNFLQSYSCINLKVIKFKGKGYKLTKKNNTLTFLFNFSHVSFFVAKKSFLKKIYKNRFAIINYDNLYLKTTSFKLVNLRKSDIFTLNGFRLKRQKI